MKNLALVFTHTNIDTELLAGLKLTGQTTRKYLAVSGQSLYSYFIPVPVPVYSSNNDVVVIETSPPLHIYGV